MKNKQLLLFTFSIFFLLTFYSIDIPFFWDGPFFSQLSVHFFENGFNGFIAPLKTDTGGFPLYSIYLTLGWKIAGKTLAVSHLILLPFLIGIAYEYFKLAKRFLTERMLFFAMLLLIIEPVFITQSILMGYDIVMIYFFLLTLNALLSNKSTLFLIGFTLLCMSNVRAMILGLSLVSLDFVLNYSSAKKISLTLLKYLIPFFIMLLWIFYHFEKTGWFLISPERENTHESIIPISMMLRQFCFITWKIVDFGRICLWIFFIFGTIYFYKLKVTKEFKTILQIVFIPLLFLMLFMIPLANPIGHKYFIVVFLSLNIGVCYLLQKIAVTKFRIFFQLIFCISLITGNFWIYPERFGNGWDSSLKVLPYFHLKKEMDEFIKNEKIKPSDIGTQFPLIDNKQYSYLSDSSYGYTNVWRGPIDKFPYFLQTNVINTDIADQVEFVKKNWKLVTQFKSGQVYISLYQNKIKP